MTANRPCPARQAQMIAAELPSSPPRGRRLPALRPRLTPGLPKILFYRSFLGALPPHCRQRKRRNVSYQRPAMKHFPIFWAFGLSLARLYQIQNLHASVHLDTKCNFRGPKGAISPGIVKSVQFTSQKISIFSSGLCGFLQVLPNIFTPFSSWGSRSYSPLVTPSIPWALGA